MRHLSELYLLSAGTAWWTLGTGRLRLLLFDSISCVEIGNQCHLHLDLLLVLLIRILTRVKSVVPSQAISVSVSNPQKVGKGLFSYVAYRFPSSSASNLLPSERLKKPILCCNYLLFFMTHEIHAVTKSTKRIANAHIQCASLKCMEVSNHWESRNNKAAATVKKQTNKNLRKWKVWENHSWIMLSNSLRHRHGPQQNQNVITVITIAV